LIRILSVNSKPFPVLAGATTSLLVGVLLLAACGTRGSETPASTRTNLVWIVIDTLRARHLEAYGYGRPTSPALTRLAAEGIVFEHMYAQSSWTKPSVASMFTGLRPGTHGAVQGKTTLHLMPALHTFAETLAEAGYENAAFSENPHISAGIGFDQGFDPFIGQEKWQGRDHQTQASVSLALEWLGDRDRSKPFHLFMQVLDPHNPWHPEERFGSLFLDAGQGPGWKGLVPGLREFQKDSGELIRTPTPAELKCFVDLYDAELREVDEALGQLFDYLRAQGLMQNTIVAVVSDHGEEFMEHGKLKHGYQVYDESIHVPLIMTMPGVEPGRRADLMLEHVDLMPTFLELLEVAPRGHLEGSSFAANLQDSELAVAAELKDILSATELNPRAAARTLRNHDWKLIEHLGEQRFELFDLRKDAEEAHDVAAEQPEKLAELRARMEAILAASPDLDLSGSIGSADDALSDQLKRIGYAGDDGDSD
jgi:arylsulfatase A-like enzyme